MCDYRRQWSDYELSTHGYLLLIQSIYRRPKSISLANHSANRARVKYLKAKLIKIYATTLKFSPFGFVGSQRYTSVVSLQETLSLGGM